MMHSWGGYFVHVPYYGDNSRSDLLGGVSSKSIMNGDAMAFRLCIIVAEDFTVIHNFDPKEHDETKANE